MRAFKLSRQVILWAGSIGPLGHMPASGTVTVAVVGIPVFWLVGHFGVRPVVFITATVFFAVVSVFLHGAGDRWLGEKDSRKLVWDELAGFFVALWLVPFSWPLALSAFFIERIIDISKVPPARQIEQHWPGGLGVVGDDMVAGAYTCLILHVLCKLAPTWMGAV